MPKLLGVLTLVLAFALALHAEAEVLPAALLQKVWQEGTVRVIVRLGTPFAAEGLLRDEVAVGLQRGDIADVGARVRSRLSSTRHRVIHHYETVPFIALELGPDALILLGQLAGMVSEIHEDEEEQLSLAESVPLIRANASQAVGFGGAGKMVAIIDSGIDKNHPFLAGRVVEEACYSFSGHCPNGTMQQLGSGSGVPCPFATCDHGTHVAGIVAGSGTGSSGVAPGARLMSIRATSLSANCGASPSPCVVLTMADQIKALERVFLLRGAYSFAAVNMSLDALAAVSGHHRLAVQHGRRDGPADLTQQGEPRKPDHLAAGAAEGMHGAMVAHVELGALAVELGLGAVARVLELARVLQDVTVEAGVVSVIGTVFRHETPTDPDSALDAQVGVPLTFSATLGAGALVGVDPTGEVGILAAAVSAANGSSVTNITIELQGSGGGNPTLD